MRSLPNYNLRRTALVSVLVLVAVVVSRAGLVLARVVASRDLPLQQFGSLATALAIVLLFGGLSSLGIPALTLAAHEGSPEVDPAIYAGTRRAVILGTIAASFGAVLTAFLIASSAETIVSVVLLAPMIFLQAAVELRSGVEQIADRPAALGRIQGSVGAAALAGALLASVFGMSAVVYAGSVGVASLGLAVVVWLGIPSLPVGWARASSLIRRAWPYALASASFAAFYFVDQAMVESVVSPSAAGTYSVAVTYVGVAILAVGAIGAHVAQHRVHRLLATSDRVRAIVVRSAVILGTTGLVVAAALAVAAPVLVPFVFGDGFEDSIDLARLLCIGVPFFYAAYPVELALNTRRLIRRRALVLALVAVFNLIANLYAIRAAGAAGAGAVTVVSMGVLACLYLLVFLVRNPLASPMAKP